jgi:hypothetical protein
MRRMLSSLEILMPYVLPQNVVSPKSYWRLDRIIIDGGAEDPIWALGSWYNSGTELWEPVIGHRWNGNDEHPLGTPISRQYPTWHIIDGRAYHSLLGFFTAEGIKPAQVDFIRQFLRLKKAA